MGARSIYFNEEMEAILKGFKDNDPNFNLTNHIKKYMESDNTMLTSTQLNIKIKVAENKRDEAIMELEHLNNIIPIIEKNREKEEEAKEEKIKNAIEVFINQKNHPNFNQYAKIHSKLTGLTTTKLMSMAKGEEERRDKEKKEKEEAYRVAQESL